MSVVATGDIRADRRLLLPGPLPPMTHLGATLFRHSAHAALRYALYQLGQPAPEAPAIQFVSLRPFLEAPKLARLLGNSPASAEVLGALIDPGGIARDPLPRRLAGALWFHRRRLAVVPRRRTKRVAAEPDGGHAAAARAELSELLPSLGEALLSELAAVLDRRQRRRRGQHLEPAQSPEAVRFLAGQRADLERLGIPDPARPSWHRAQPKEPVDDSIRTALALPAHRGRGEFREQYRFVLDRVRPHLLALGRRARSANLLESAEDVFFLPLDLVEDLEADDKSDWLDHALASNRAEWQDLAGRNAPADTLGDVPPEPRLEIEPELAPLVPLV
ncbi:MAG: hypothetical protein ACE5GX_08730 [Thermoanaerobaculia bacterium]